MNIRRATTGLAAFVLALVSVGATTKTDQVAYFSNIASFLSLLAPGDSIDSSVPGGGYQPVGGTSMAAPHVAGAWSLITQANPSASVSTILTARRTTGAPIRDTRLFFGTGLVIPRIQVFDALVYLGTLSSPPPVVTTLAPTSGRAGSGDGLGRAGPLQRNRGAEGGVARSEDRVVQDGSFAARPPWDHRS